MDILQVICSDNFIVVNKTLISELGIEPALLLGELASEAVFWTGQEKTEDGYFYSTIENVEKKTSLTAYQQRRALQVLKDNELIDVISKKGNPPKRYIRINEEAILKLFNFQKLKNFTFESKEILHSKVKKLNTNKNIPNKNEIQNNITTIIESVGFSSDEFVEALNGFLEMRKKIRKPATERAVKLLLKNVVDLSQGNEEVAIQILNQSTTNSWLGVYPLKNNSYGSGRPVRNEFMDMLNSSEVTDFEEDGSNSSFGFTTDGFSEYPN